MKNRNLRACSAWGVMAMFGAGLGATAPAYAQSTPPASTSPSNTTSETPTSPEEQPPAPGKGANPATADQTDTKGEQAIIITGTVSRQTQTASPVTVVTASNLQDRGINTVADAVQLLPANNAGTDPVSWTAFGFATGASAPSLRGFNDAYTITLFDGLRSAYYPLADDGFRNFVDINTIPESIIDRIEVLQDGASANYGADAVAGVINVIVKKEIQGIHANGSYGLSQHGDARERRFDLTLGYGSLADQGFNIYLNGEYQKNDPLFMRDRGYPFNTADQSKVCNSSGVCAVNGIRNGIQYNGDYLGFSRTQTPYAIPYAGPGAPVPDANGNLQWTPLNPAGGCVSGTPYTLTPDQIAMGTSSASGYPLLPPNTVCQEDYVKQYQMYDPEITRKGLNFHATVNITPDIQAYAMANWYEAQTDSIGNPLSFTGSTTPAGPGATRVVLSQILLPVYVCPSAVTTVSANGVVTSTGCDATNGVLNPNNPFAAQGDMARISAEYNQPTETTTDANTYRVSGGVSGNVSGFDFNVDATMSRVDLDVRQSNYILLSNLLSAIGTGSYNFADQTLNTDAQRQFIAPDVLTRSVSKLAEIRGTVGRNFVDLPGGPLNVAVGAAYRFESIDNPSSNPPNFSTPTDRFFGINAVAASGSRHVWSAYYSVDVPAFTGFDFKAEGRYDKYSTSQSAFSPKFELQYKPIRAIKLRGTYSRGFRIPSFNESSANGIPTTGYVSGQIVCSNPTYTAFCAAHASNPTYYGPGSYSYGLSSVGNPDLSPEKSTSWTAGVVLEPERHISATIDWWHTKIKDIIIPATASQAIFDQYYGNNGVVTVPGVTVLPANPDPNNPNALPLIGFIQSPYINADSEVGEGIDFTLTGRVPVGRGGVRLISTLAGSYLRKLTLTDPLNGVEKFAGTLSPCAITSCSGAPKWRGQWSNTLDFGGKASLTATVYYTSGYSEVSTDSGGIYGDCLGSVANGSIIGVYYDGTPIQCRAKATWDVDLTGQVKVGHGVTVYGNIINLLNTAPPYEPDAAYGIYNFNPAWADKNFIGRFFRIGVRYDFEPAEHFAPPPAPVLPPPPPAAAPATQTCPDGSVILATAACPPPPPPPPPPAPVERGE